MNFCQYNQLDVWVSNSEPSPASEMELIYYLFAVINCFAKSPIVKSSFLDVSQDFEYLFAQSYDIWDLIL